VDRTAPLLGRDEELRVLDRLLDDAANGSAGVLVVAGEPGVGKSSLIDAVAARARSLDFTVLSASGLEFEREIAFSGLLSLVRPLLPSVDLLPPFQSSALRGALGIEAPAGRSLPVYGAALSLLAAAAEDGPVLVAVDDAHWVDRASLEALLFSAHRLDADRVAIVFATRRADEHMLDRSGFRRLELQGLSRAAAIELLATLGIGAEVAQRCWERTQGNPLALAETARSLSHDQAAGAAPLPDVLEIGDYLADAFGQRLTVLSEEALRVLEVAAVEPTGELVVLADALQRLGRDHGTLAEVEAAGLIQLDRGHVRFAHPLARSAVCARLGGERRRDVHRAVAAALREAGQGDRAARHLAAATDRPDEAVAAALEGCAADALRRGAQIAAAEAFDASAAMSTSSATRARRQLHAAEAWWSGGEPIEVLRRLEPALASTEDPATRARMAALLGQAETWFRGPAKAATRLEIQAAEARDEHPALATELWLHAATAHLLRIDVASARAATDAAGSAAIASGDPGALLGSQLLGSTLDVFEGRASPDPLSAAARHQIVLAALRAELAGAETLAALTAFVSLLTEDFEAAIALLRQVVQLGTDGGMVGQCVFAVHVLADSLWRSGRWVEALAELEQAESLARSVGLRDLAPLCQASLGMVEAGLGLDERCREHARLAAESAEPMGIDIVRAWSAAAVGLLELGARHPREAVEAFDVVAHVADHVPEPGWLWWRADAVEALLAAGRRADAEAAARRLDELACATGRRWAKAAAARCQAMVGDDEASDAAYTTALDTFRDIGVPFEEARTLLHRGEHRRRRGRGREAAGDLAAARTIFVRLGARQWAERAAASSDRSWDQRGWLTSVLSEAELRVALVVGNGASNREAAERLFLSVKTVDFHLQSVYRKLDIHSRAQLVRHLAGLEPWAA
jgi:DNA-binding CsgD family transcriptional regulator